MSCCGQGSSQSSLLLHKVDSPSRPDANRRYSHYAVGPGAGQSTSRDQALAVREQDLVRRERALEKEKEAVFALQVPCASQCLCFACRSADVLASRRPSCTSWSSRSWILPPAPALCVPAGWLGRHAPPRRRRMDNCRRSWPSRRHVWPRLQPMPSHHQSPRCRSSQAPCRGARGIPSMATARYMRTCHTWPSVWTPHQVLRRVPRASHMQTVTEMGMGMRLRQAFRWATKLAACSTRTWISTHSWARSRRWDRSSQSKQRARRSDFRTFGQPCLGKLVQPGQAANRIAAVPVTGL